MTEVELPILLIWSLAVSLSGGLAALLCGITLKPKHGKGVTILGYLVACLVGFLLTFQVYTQNITNDFGGIILFSIIIWIASILLSDEFYGTSLFVSIMATIIANVTTFFLCGTTLSFIDKAADPYNMVTISKFIGIKLILFLILFLVYQFKLRKNIRLAIKTLDRKVVSYFPISLLSFFGFYAINLITNKLQIFPAIPAMRYYFIGIYGIICLIFLFEYYQIFDSVFWSSRALRTEAELDVASKIQKEMLPCIFPPFPDRNAFDIFATMEPAKEVGGDFYDFFLIDDDHLAVVVADVSGKGVPAALFMVISKTLIKNYTLMGYTPADVFTSVNEQLCENNEVGMFVTAWMGVLEISTGKFTYVNAGHNPPLLKKHDGEFEYLVSRPGFVLAGMEEIQYKQAEMILEKDDILYLYTDGVTEATNGNNELYGEDRLQKVLNGCNTHESCGILQTIKEDIDAFVKEAPQFDDITMLGLKINDRYADVRVI